MTCATIAVSTHGQLAGLAVSDSPTTTKRAGQNRTKWDRAAILLAEDELSDEAIAKQVRVSRSTLSEWKLDTEFNALVGNYKGAIIAQALKLPIAKKHHRVQVLNDLFLRDMQIIKLRAERHRQEREESPASAARAVFGDVTPAEAETGRLVAQPKIAANGKTVVEWAFDKALASEIRETLKQAAQELGQWVEKGELSGPGGTPITVQLVEREDGPR